MVKAVSMKTCDDIYTCMLTCVSYLCGPFMVREIQTDALANFYFLNRIQKAHVQEFSTLHPHEPSGARDATKGQHITCNFG